MHCFSRWRENRRLRNTWKPVKQWRSTAIWTDKTEAGTIFIVGYENGIGERKVEMEKSCLPNESWGNPKKTKLWVDALAWANTVSEPEGRDS